MPTPKKPTVLKLLHGEKRKCRLNQNEAMPDVPESIPDPPDWLEPSACQVWRDNIGVLHKAGLFTHADRDMFAAYCFSFGIVIDNARFLKEKREAAKVKNPASGYVDDNKQVTANTIMINRNLDRAIGIAKCFGMVPNERGRLNVPKQKEKKNSLEDFRSRNAKKG